MNRKHNQFFFGSMALLLFSIAFTIAVFNIGPAAKLNAWQMKQFSLQAYYPLLTAAIFFIPAALLLALIKIIVDRKIQQ